LDASTATNTATTTGLAVYKIKSPAAFTVTTLAASREACYKSFLQTPGAAGTVTKAAGTPITSPYWYLYEKVAGNRGASGKVISSDWMALMTTGSAAWASGCAKADWTCALYAPATGATAGSCGFTPNSDATFKLTASPFTNPFTPTAYVPSATTTANSANAIITQDSGAW